MILDNFSPGRSSLAHTVNGLGSTYLYEIGLEFEKSKPILVLVRLSLSDVWLFKQDEPSSVLIGITRWSYGLYVGSSSTSPLVLNSNLLSRLQFSHSFLVKPHL